MTEPIDYPPYNELADEDDELGWDRDVHGKMLDFASDEEPETEEWEPDAVPDQTT